MRPPSLTPAYVGCYVQMAEVARAHGYALAVHGTAQRDLDVVAIPWTEEATDAETLIRALAEAVGQRVGDALVVGYPHKHSATLPHGRQGYSLTLASDAAGTVMATAYVDVSVMPRTAPSQPAANAPGREETPGDEALAKSAVGEGAIDGDAIGNAPKPAETCRHFASDDEPTRCTDCGAEYRTDEGWRSPEEG